MWLNRQFLADLVTFSEEILNGKIHFLCSLGVLIFSTLVTQVHPAALLAKQIQTKNKSIAATSDMGGKKNMFYCICKTLQLVSSWIVIYILSAIWNIY